MPGAGAPHLGRNNNSERLVPHQLIHCWQDFITTRYSERAAWQKVVLNVNNQETFLTRHDCARHNQESNLKPHQDQPVGRSLPWLQNNNKVPMVCWL